MAEEDSWDADSFEPEEPMTKPAALDKWEGEDEEEEVKDNWDDEEDEAAETSEVKNTEEKVPDKKKLSAKMKEKEELEKLKQEEFTAVQESTERTAEDLLAEKLRIKQLQEDSDLQLAQEAFGVGGSVAGIDAMSPSSKEDFTEFEKLLKDKISSCDKSVHYPTFLESLFRDLCLSLELEDLKKMNASLTILLSEKQKQEKQTKNKKKKKGVLPGGGLKAKLKDDLEDYGVFDGGFTQDFEDFM